MYVVCLFVYVCIHVRMYVSIVIYQSLCTYVSMHACTYVASRQVEELQKMVTQECPVVVSSNIDTMDLSFLLRSSGNLHRLLCSYFLVFETQQISLYKICVYVYTVWRKCLTVQNFDE